MNKTELIEAVVESIRGSKISKSVATTVINAMMESIKGAVKNGDAVVLVNFGTFSIQQRAARVGRNPNTGESVSIEASFKPVFKAGKVFRDSINN